MIDRTVEVRRRKEGWLSREPYKDIFRVLTSIGIEGIGIPNMENIFIYTHIYT